MGVTFRRQSWPDPTRWRCLACGCDQAAAEHAAAGGAQPGPYNEHQVVCSLACARARKTELQRQRRAGRQLAQRAAWTCALCGGPPTPFVRGNRTTCSPACARSLRTSSQQERRFNQTIEHALAAMASADALNG